MSSRSVPAAAALVASLAVLVAVALHAPTAAGQEPSISMVPTSGGCGMPINVAGSGFPANADVIVVAIPDIAIGLEFEEPVATTDADGAFETTISVPDDPAACPGDHGSDWIVFACAPPDCDQKASAPFTLTATELPETGSGSTVGGLGSAQLSLALSALGTLLLLGGGAYAAGRVRRR